MDAKKSLQKSKIYGTVEYAMSRTKFPKAENMAIIKFINNQGPVVQSIVSLKTSSRRQLVKYITTKLSNTLLFFVGKM